MKSLEQARREITQAIDAWRQEDGHTMPALAAAANVSVSMVYQFMREGGPALGEKSVTGLAPLLPSIDAATWLAAMGVDYRSEVSA